jgi:2-iminobutanoate/2-iminopropanoate deaminase
MPVSERFNPPGVAPPVGQYSNVAIVPANADTIHVAGQLPVDDAGSVVHPADFAAQADRVFSMLAATLEGCGSSLTDVVVLRAFLVRDEDWAGYRDARARAFAAHGVEAPPTATTIVVQSLYGGALIELDAVAVRAA